MNDPLKEGLRQLGLTWLLENCDQEIAGAARKNLPHRELLARLVHGECEARQTRAVQRRLRAARMPMTRTIDSFDWNWPENVNRDQVLHLFTLGFLREKANVVLIGNVGLGKTHIAAALAARACEHGHAVLCAQAVDIVNDLAEARDKPGFARAVQRYAKPALLVVDELGYLPVDRVGAELLFQVLGARYERGSTVITTNRPYKEWATTFANDATLASAVLDRVLHHCETIVITGRSYRMKDRIERQ
ncbi:MAG: IS21-like element helper ATPase IstB [Lentisphaeria bacterium]|jgi:DNA replication protein DnaC|nr:IS21-like element helper ATPase IstB [Lentisphaeria bacterium]